MKRTKRPIREHLDEQKAYIDEDIKVLESLRVRLEQGAKNHKLITAELLITKREIDVLFGVISATITYYEITKQ